MSTIYLAVAVAEIVVMLALFPRLATGPAVSDRVVALNAMSTQATIAVLFFAAYADASNDLDVAIWLASFSYLATFVWSRLLEQELL